MLLYAIYPVDLASHSSALTPYETSSINRFHLASYVWLDYLAAQVLDAFHIWPSQSLRFYNVSRSWTYSRFFNRELHYHCAITTYYDVLTQLLNNLLDYTIQLTTYLSSRGVISRLLRSMYAYCYAPTNHSNCIQALRSDPSDKYTTLSHTNWQVGFVVKSAPPVTFHSLKFP